MVTSNFYLNLSLVKEQVWVMFYPHSWYQPFVLKPGLTRDAAIASWVLWLLQGQCQDFLSGGAPMTREFVQGGKEAGNLCVVFWICLLLGGGGKRGQRPPRTPDRCRPWASRCQMVPLMATSSKWHPLTSHLLSRSAVLYNLLILTWCCGLLLYVILLE